MKKLISIILIATTAVCSLTMESCLAFDQPTTETHNAVQTTYNSDPKTRKKEPLSSKLKTLVYSGLAVLTIAGIGLAKKLLKRQPAGNANKIQIDKDLNNDSPIGGQPSNKTDVNDPLINQTLYSKIKVKELLDEESHLGEESPLDKQPFNKTDKKDQLIKQTQSSELQIWDPENNKKELISENLKLEELSTDTLNLSSTALTNQTLPNCTSQNETDVNLTQVLNSIIVNEQHSKKPPNNSEILNVDLCKASNEKDQIRSKGIWDKLINKVYYKRVGFSLIFLPLLAVLFAISCIRLSDNAMIYLAVSGALSALLGMGISDYFESIEGVKQLVTIQDEEAGNGTKKTSFFLLFFDESNTFAKAKAKFNKILCFNNEKVTKKIIAYNVPRCKKISAEVFDYLFVLETPTLKANNKYIGLYFNTYSCRDKTLSFFDRGTWNNDESPFSLKRFNRYKHPSFEIDLDINN